MRSGRYALAGALVIAAAARVAAQGPPTLQLTLEDALSRAVETSHRLAEARARETAAQAGVAVRESAERPTVTANAAYTRTNHVLPFSIPSAIGIPILVYPDVPNNYSTRLEMRWPIYTGGRIPAAQQASAAALRQAEAERDRVSQTVSVELVEAYFGLQQAAKAATVRAESLKGLQAHLDNTLALERQGFATKAQSLQATVSRDQADRDWQRASNDLATARVVLATLLHSEDLVTPTTDLFVISTPLGSIGEFQREALAHHPELAQLIAVQDQAAQAVRASEAELKPEAYAFGQYDFYQHDALLTDSNWAIGIGFQYVLFSGNGRFDRVNSARERYDAAGAAIRDVRERLETQVARAWNELETARQTFLLLESSIASAEENVRLQNLSFREGQATSLDVIDAQLGLARAQIDRSQSAYLFDLALARLLELSGQSVRYAEYIHRADRAVASWSN